MTAQNPPANTPADPATLTYEQARDELVQIVGQLESGQAPLDVTMSLWERGHALATRCRSILDSAEQRVAQLTAQPTAQPGAQPTGQPGTGTERPETDGHATYPTDQEMPHA